MGGVAWGVGKGAGEKSGKAGEMDMDKAEREIRRKEGIICSMTQQERRKPDIIKATRKRRIAMGAGVEVHEVNRLLKEFGQMQDVMKKMKGGAFSKMLKRLGGMQGLGGLMGGGFPGLPRG